MTDLAIIIPVFNEGENFKRVFELAQQKIATPFKIYVIYDFDEDNTLPVIEKLHGKFPEQIIAIKNNYGSGVVRAIKTGFHSVAESIVLVTMGDLSDDLSDVDKMYKMIVADGYDLVCGSRYMKGGGQIGGGLVKSLLSRLAGLSLHLLTGIPTNDATNSFKMYRKKIFKEISIESNGGFEIGLEIVVKSFLKGFKIAELPTIWHDRVKGKSNFKLMQWIPAYLRWYFLAIIGKIKQRLRGGR